MNIKNVLLKAWDHIFALVNRNKGITMALAVMVTVATVYSLILPASTLDKEKALEQGGIDVEEISEEVDSEEAPADIAVEKTEEEPEQEKGEPEQEEEEPEQKDKEPEQEDKSGESSEQVKLISKETELTKEGKDYSVSVIVDKKAAIPEDTELAVDEIKDQKDEGDNDSETPDYDELYQKAEKALKEKIGDIDIKTVKFYDISLLSGDAEVEPSSDVDVKIKSDIIKKEDDNNNYHVIHFGEGEPEVLDSEAKDGEISFTTDGFSVYAVVDGPVTPESRATVNFYGIDGSIVATYYVKNSDVLKNDPDLDPEQSYSYIDDIVVDPGIGGELPSGQVFLGWSMDDLMNNEGTPYSDDDIYAGADYTVDTIRMNVEAVREVLVELNFHEGDIVNIYPMIFKYYNITYYGDYVSGEINTNVSLGTDTVYLMTDKNEAEYTVSQTYAADSHQNFKGWRPTSDTAGNIKDKATDAPLDIYPNNTKAIVSGDVTMYVEAPRGNWLTYDANARGATFNAPQFYLANEETEISPNATVDSMERNGYTLEVRADGEPGWYTLKPEYMDDNGDPVTAVPRDENGYLIISDTYFDPFTFGDLLTDNLTIYAKWVPKDTANYTVIFHTQNLDRTGYEMAGSYVGSGRVGDPIPFTFVNNTDEDYVTGAGERNGHYTGFCLNHSENNTLGTLQQTTGYTQDGQPIKENVAIPTITPEGDAVLNIYYDRIEYNFRFYYYRQRGNQASYAQNSRNCQNDAQADWGNVYNVATWGNTNTPPTQTYGPDQQDSVEGYTAHFFVLKAYYGQNISSMWPQYSQLGTVGTYQAVSFVMMNGSGLKKKINTNGLGVGRGSDTIKGTIDTMDEMILGKTEDANGNFVVIRYNTRNEWRYHILYEQVDGEDYSGYAVHDYAFNGKLYYEDHIYNSRSTNQNVSEQTAPQFSGYEYVGLSNQTGQSGGTNGNNARWTTTESGTTCYNVRFYYDRLVYPITFYDGNYVTGNNNPGNTDHNRASQLIKEIDDQGDYVEKEEVFIEHGAPIPDSVVNNYEPPIQPGEEGYVFEGWYLDEACSPGTEFSYEKMPVGGVTVYAKWRQIRYRVFLHSEAFMIDPDTGLPVIDEHGNYVYDDTLYWGSSSQAMSFGIAYGGKVSLPEGTREEYEFLGWFKDKECTQLFTASTALNEETVPASPVYNKDTDYTDYLDKHGNVDVSLGDPYNSDANRSWVTKKLDLYGKWRRIIVGAEGIGVVYDVGTLGNPSTAPTDTLLYKDKSGAVAQPACKPTDEEQYSFLYWVVQRYDEVNQEYVDATDEEGHLITCYPGDSFTCRLDYAKKVANDDDTPDNPSYTYTMQLRAEYGLKETAKPTHIDWYKNYGNDVGVYHQAIDSDTELQINEATDICLIPTDPGYRPGYKFVGWARIPTTESESHADVDPSKNPWAKIVSEEVANRYLYLIYHEEDNGYFTVNTDDGEKTVTKVAADEKLEYHDMYAVWKKVYNVTVEKKVTTAIGDDRTRPFTFDPSDSLDSDTFTLKHGDYKLFKGITSGETISVEELLDDASSSIYTVSVAYKYTTDEDGNPIPEAQQESVTIQNGAAIENLHGDMVITFTNSRKTFDIDFIKTDLEGGGISGANFTISIWDEISQTYVAYNIDESSNSFTIGTRTLPLPAGKYMITETSAPDGYIIRYADTKFTVGTDGSVELDTDNTNEYAQVTPAKDGNNAKITIQNEPGKELPMTGGSGTHMIYLMGMMLVLLSGGALTVKKRVER